MSARSTTITFVSAAALLFLAPAAPSYAQAGPPKATAPGAPAAQTDASALARARFTDGVAFAKKKDWQRAYAAFLEAWKLKTHPQIALNLGRAEIEVGKYRNAMEHLQYCVSHSEAGDPDAKLAGEWLAEAEKKVAKLVITVNGPASDAFVDGELAGKTPLGGPVLVDPGKHVVEIRRGAAGETRTAEVEAGASINVKFEGTPTVAIVSSPEPTLPEPVRPAASVPWRTPTLVTGGALAAAGLVVGGVFLGIAADQGAAKQQAAADPEGRAAAASAIKAEAQAHEVALWSFVGAGVALAGTAALFFVTRPSSGAKAQGSVSIHRDGAVASIQLAF